MCIINLLISAHWWTIATIGTEMQTKALSNFATIATKVSESFLKPQEVLVYQREWYYN